MKPTKRKEAIQQGAPFYNTGKPCVRGHYADRRAIGGQCLECEPILHKERLEMEKKIYKQAVLKRVRGIMDEAIEKTPPSSLSKKRLVTR